MSTILELVGRDKNPLQNTERRVWKNRKKPSEPIVEQQEDVQEPSQAELVLKKKDILVEIGKQKQIRKSKDFVLQEPSKQTAHNTRLQEPAKVLGRGRGHRKGLQEPSNLLHKQEPLQESAKPHNTRLQEPSQAELVLKKKDILVEIGKQRHDEGVKRGGKIGGRGRENSSLQEPAKTYAHNTREQLAKEAGMGHERLAQAEYLTKEASEETKEKQSSRPWTQSRKFVKFPRIMIADKKLSSEAKELALVLEAFDIRHGGIVFPGLEVQGEAINKSRPIVEKLLDELEVNGCLHRKRRYGRPTKYTMTFPSINSIEELVERYQLFGIHLTDEDFWDVVTFDKGDLSLFFTILKRFRKEYGVKGRRSSTTLEKKILKEWAKVKFS